MRWVRVWCPLAVAIAALLVSVYALYIDNLHWRESSESQQQRYEVLNKQYEETKDIALNALETEKEHYQELSKQYEELTKPHTEHEEINDKLDRLDKQIESAKDRIHSWETLKEDTRDYQNSLNQAIGLSSEAEEAWLNKDYGEADKLINEAYDFLSTIPIPPAPPTPAPTPAPPAPPTPLPSPVQEFPVSTPSTNWGLIGGIIAAVVVIGGLIAYYFLIWRRKHYE